MPTAIGHADKTDNDNYTITENMIAHNRNSRFPTLLDLEQNLFVLKRIAAGSINLSVILGGYEGTTIKDIF